MSFAADKTLIIACGALAKEIVLLSKQLGVDADLQCLPADYHNRPEKIVPGLKAILDEKSSSYQRILIGYGDCGTGGGLDRLLVDYPHALRLPGAHCYAFFSGLNRFNKMMEEELGSFFLTDYLVRHFDTIIMKGMGLDRFPHLTDVYFKNYKKIVYLAQIEDSKLKVKAQEAALKLGLSFEYKVVGYGALATALAMFEIDPPKGMPHKSISQKVVAQSV